MHILAGPTNTLLSLLLLTQYGTPQLTFEPLEGHHHAQPLETPKVQDLWDSAEGWIGQ